jgi:hypothetical protein
MMWHRRPSIGNDIVDLLAPEPVLHPRYVERVFTAKEQDFVSQGRSNLWLAWAAKEAAYKAVKRLKPDTHFTPQAFELDAEGNVVIYDGVQLPCYQTIDEDYVAVQCLSGKLDWRYVHHWITGISEVGGDLSGSPSVAVRSFASRCIGKLLNVAPTQLTFPIFRTTGSLIPCLSVRGVPSRHLVSFSHHGQFLACSFKLAE